MNFRVSEAELSEIKRISEQWGTPCSEVWRRLLTTVKVLYDSDLTLSDALAPSRWSFRLVKQINKLGDKPLHEVMRPIPELIKILDAKRVMASLGGGE